MVLKGAAKNYDIPYATAASATDKGDLKSGAVSTVENVADKAYYGLTIKNEKACFARIKSGDIPEGKAYLVVNSAETRDIIYIDDETTGIDSIENSQSLNGQYFNVAGQRVAQPTKGLYIVNGKKFVVK